MQTDLSLIYNSWLNNQIEFYRTLKPILAITDSYQKAVNLSLFMNNFLDDEPNKLKKNPRINPKDRTLYKQIMSEQDLKSMCYYFENYLLQTYLNQIAGALKLKLILPFDDLQAAVYYSKHSYVADSLSKLFLEYSSRETFIKTLKQNVLADFSKHDSFDFKCIYLEAFNPTVVKPEVCICISGFLSESSDHFQEWKDFTPFLDKYTDVYYYSWCAETPISMLFETSSTVLMPAVKGTKLILDKLSGSHEIKSNFIKAKNQARVCGKVLAHVLASESIFKFQTVTLIGFSLGSHIIKHCLRELFNLQAFDILENVIMLAGATQYKNKKKWASIIPKIIHGKMINVFSTHDEILNKLYYLSTGYTATGAKENPLVDNLDVSSKKLGHLDYRNNLLDIITSLNLY